MDLPIKSGAPAVVPLDAATDRVSPFRWWPLYLLGFGAVALIVGVWRLPLPEDWRIFLLLPLTGLVCVLAFSWTRRNERLLASEGVDAKAPNDPILAGLLEQARPMPPATPAERSNRVQPQTE